MPMLLPQHNVNVGNAFASLVDRFHPPPEAQAYILGCHCGSRSDHITSLPRVILSSHCCRAELSKTILAQTNWTPAIFNWVNWTSLGQAFRQVVQGHLQATMAKLQHNLLATAVHHLHSHRNNKIDKRCFRCQALHKDFDHILWCPHGSLAGPSCFRSGGINLLLLLTPSRQPNT
jgi:hypothetical protein